MATPGFLSKRVKKKSLTGLTSDRYEFLGLEQAEPDLGDPLVGPSSIGANPIPIGSGEQYVLTAYINQPGKRYWTSGSNITASGLSPGSFTIFDDNVQVGIANSFTTFNFIGNGVSVDPVGTLPEEQTGIATIRITVSDVVAPGGLNSIPYKASNGFLAGATDFVYSSGNIGIGTTIPTTKLDIVGNVRVSGVSTLGVTTTTDLTTQQLYVSGITTVGFLTATSLRVSGITTVGFLTATNLIVSGITTSDGVVVTTDNDYKIGINTVLSSTTLGTGVTYSSLTSVGTLNQLNVSTSGITTVGFLTATSLIVSGITTVGFLTATNLRVSGVSTFNGTLNVVPTATSIAGLFSGTTSSDMVRITQLGTGNAFIVEDSANPDSTPFVVNASGSVGVGVTNPASNTQVAIAGTLGISEVSADGTRTLLSSSDSGFTLNHNDNSNIHIQSQGITKLEYQYSSDAWVLPATTETKLVIGTGATTGISNQKLQVTGGAYISDNLGIGTINPITPLQVETYGVKTGVGTFIASFGVSTTIDSFSVSSTDFKISEYTVHIGFGSSIQAQKVIVTQDQSTAYTQEYGVVYNNSLLVSIGATISGGNCILQATPQTGISGLTTYRFVRNTLL